MFSKAKSVFKQDCSVIYSYRFRQKIINQYLSNVKNNFGDNLRASPAIFSMENIVLFATFISAIHWAILN